jgi:hypothetical protein
MDDQRMSDLIVDAVADVEPTDRLAEIRRRTSPRRRRQGWYAAGGAALAAAAAVTAIALAGNQSQPKAEDPPIGTPSPDATAGESVYPVYFLGETPTGTRLYREFQRAPGFMWTEIAIQLLSMGPDDPDYWTAWAPGTFETAKVIGQGEGRLIEVTLVDAHLHDRPDGMSETEAALAIEQVIYTLQAVVGDRLPVQFRLDGNPIDQVLGVPTSEPLANAPQLEVLSLVSISDPSEGQVVSGAFTAKGAASSFEATVPWEIRDSAENVVLEGFATATGYLGRLHPWETEVDVSSLDPGTYTFVAMTSDPSGGAEGAAPYVDTRTVVVE